jgi:NAD(P)-dependent dehydrogenase (short-subunit alcohol dehydrogenase family)
MAEIRLDGRIAIVTGAAQGLGRVMAAGLARAGARVALADINGEKLETAASRIDEEVGSRSTIVVPTDINDLDQCERLVAKCCERFGGLHVLVNAARRPHRGPGLPASGNSLPFWQSDPHIWRETVQTNVVGSFFLSRTVAPHLLGQEWGRIINITTSLGTMCSARSSPYGLTKIALEAATLIWAADLAGTGVTVNSLLPGGSCANEPGKLSRSGKPLLPPEIMNPPLLWLASDLSDGCTGNRYVAKLWDASLPLSEAASRAEEPVQLKRAD